MPKLSDASHEAEASIWDLVFGGKRELVWASQLFCTESQCSSATERILFANCEVRSSTRGAFKVISAICLVGDQALVVTTFRVPGQENCWPPPSLPFFNQTPLCSDCPACCWGHSWLQATAWWLPLAPCCYAVGCSSKWGGINFNNTEGMAPSVLQCLLSLIVRILSASSWLCFGWVWQLKSILNSACNWALRILT